MVVLVEGEVEDGLVADLLAVLLVQVVPDLHGGLQRVLEPAEVVVLETSCELTLCKDNLFTNLMKQYTIAKPTCIYF